MKKNLLAILAAALLLSIPSAAQTGQRLDPAKVKQLPALQKSTSKISDDLTRLLNKTQTGARRESAGSKTLPAGNGLDKYLQFRGGKVLIDVTVTGDADSTAQTLKELGFVTKGKYGRVISGLIAPGDLDKLEAITNVKFVGAAYKPYHHSYNHQVGLKMLPDAIKKPVISQGDTAMYSYVARDKYKLDGSGIKLGILSDSYNNLATAEIGVKNGELPGPTNPFGYEKPVTVLEDLEDSSGIDEGRGMAEIVHDVAPGAELAFQTAFNGQAGFAQGILDLAKFGCKVIVDDIIYFAEPFFQDGIIAQAVDEAKSKGSTYFSAAGNEANQSYESDFRGSTYAPLGPSYGTAHNFSAPGSTPNYFQPIQIPIGGVFIASFQWDQPFYSAGGEGATTDLDIFLLDNEGRVVAVGGSDNLATGDAVEVFRYQNTTRSTAFYVLILNYAGPNPAHIKYVNFADVVVFNSFPQPVPGIYAPTLIGHAKAAGAIAVGAAPFYRTPAYGTAIPLAERFSSLGGVPNYFNRKGERIRPLVRRKPELVAPDGGNNSFFPPAIYFGRQDILLDTDTFPNFFGTSAAAPHAAAVAALMMQAFRPISYIPDIVKGVMVSSTVDMDNIYTPGFDQGFDFLTGPGLLRADIAVGKVYDFTHLLKPAMVANEEDKSVQRTGSVFPNPSTSNFKVNLPFSKVRQADLEVYSIDGKLMSRQARVTSSIIDIDASGYKAGTYILKVKQGTETRTFKLIKQ